MSLKHLGVTIVALALLVGPASHAAAPDVAAGSRAAWHKLADADRAPGWIWDVVRDTANDRLVTVASGTDHTVVDTWVREGGTWREIETEHAPSHRMLHSLAYDEARGEVVLFGGMACDGCRSYEDTWVFDGKDWHQRTTPTIPSYSIRPRMAYDRDRQEVVLYTAGHEEYGTLTWTWDGSDWTEHDVELRPSDDLYHFAMAWDPSRQAVVLHGGFSFESASPVFDDRTWAWDGSAWSVVADDGPEVAFHGMATHRDAIVLFGGRRQSVDQVDTWVLREDGWVRQDLQRRPQSSNFNFLAPISRGRLLLTQVAGPATPTHWVYRPPRST